MTESENIRSVLHYDTDDIRTNTQPRDDDREGVIAVGSCEAGHRKARFEYTWHAHKEAMPVLIDTDEVLISCNVEYWNDDGQCVGVDAEHQEVDQHTDLEAWVGAHFEGLDPQTVLTERYNRDVPELRRPPEKFGD
jgi:hypothetical protein